MRSAYQAVLWASSCMIIVPAKPSLELLNLSALVARRWCLAVLRACLVAPWSQELLDHELGEEVFMHALQLGGPSVAQVS